MPFGALTMGNLGPKLGSSGGRRGRLPRFSRAFALRALALSAFVLRTFALGALMLGALALGCGGATPAPPPTPRPSADRAPRSRALDHGWGERVIWQVPVRVRLPDAATWHATTRGTFTVLEHAPTHSSLTLRVTLAPRLVRPAECEADARLARPSLPGAADATAIVDERTITAPEGFDVRLVVGVEPAPKGVRGWALAVGAATSRCYVGAYETLGEGPLAAEEVADRLALAVSGILETMRVPNVDRRVSPPVGVK
jgi:hypothetical protein